MTNDKATEDFVTTKMEGGFMLSKEGRDMAFLRGTEGSLTAEPAPDRVATDAAQDCFDKCFAASDGTTGAAHKCAKQCALT